uniref:Uncharacterized protein n=1 Tax=Chrysotila carterae TaxID=13221 RepID=A0A7S4BEP8_CHRCT
MRVGDPCWLRAPKGQTEPFSPGKIVNVQQGGDRLTVLKPDGTEAAFDLKNADVFAANPTGSNAPDHCALLHLNEPSVLENTRQRFLVDDIYTYTGKILIAVNPFKTLPIYEEDYMAKYKEKDVGAKGAMPHVFAMGEAAFKHVKRHGAPTAIIMSGESGSGKTETTKYLMRYLAWRSESISQKAEGKLTTLADAILKSNPLLEAFGNAKTVRNNNSSRFGKYVQLYFHPGAGTMVGALIRSFFLERPRVTSVTTGERCYHSFYQLLDGLPEAARGACQIKNKTAADFRVLSMSGCRTVDGVSDKAAFETLCDALLANNIGAEQQTQMWAIMSGLLHLTDVDFDDDDERHALLTKPSEPMIATAIELLGCPDALEKLTHQFIVTGATVIKRPLSAKEASQNRDAVARFLYDRLFKWLIGYINSALDGPDKTDRSTCIGLLDIFGFERFEKNSLEQLLINYSNEKLQAFFLGNVFRAEKEIHASEGVTFPTVDYANNESCVELIDKSPNGILRLLDTSCKTRAGTDKAFFEGVNAAHATHEFVRPVKVARKLPSEAFVVMHFAGAVCYEMCTGSWLSLNNDTLPIDLHEMLEKSSAPLVNALLDEPDDVASKAGAKPAAKPGGPPTALERKGSAVTAVGKRSSRFNSVSRRFVTDLSELLRELTASTAHFVRCVKPNSEQKPALFDGRMVLEQLRCLGVLDAVELMKAAFPVRIPFEVIYGRYAHKLPADLRVDEPAAFCEVVALASGLPPSSYALGLTKLFLRASQGAELEKLEDMPVDEVAALLKQKIMEWNKRKSAAVVLTRKGRIFVARRRVELRRNALLMLQRCGRGMLSRTIARTLRVQRAAQRAKEREEAKAKGAPHHDPSTVALNALEAFASAGAGHMMPQVAAGGKQHAESSGVGLGGAHGRLPYGRPPAVEKGEQPPEEMNELQKQIRELQAALMAEKATNASLRAGLTHRKDHMPEHLHESSTRNSTTGTGLPALPKPVRLNVTIERGEADGTLGAEIDEWQGQVTVAAVAKDGPAKDILCVGDEIEGVGGARCKGDIKEVLRLIIESPDVVQLAVCRRPAVPLLAHEVMLSLGNSWEPVLLTLLSSRMLVYAPVGANVGADGYSNFNAERERQTGESAALFGEVNLLKLSRLEVAEASEECPAELLLWDSEGGKYHFRYELQAGEGFENGNAVLRAYDEQIQVMIGPDAEDSTEMPEPMRKRASTVWQQGYLELAIGLDEWATRYIVVSEKERGALMLFADHQARRRNTPERLVPLRSIISATRTTGPYYFEWGITLQLLDGERLELLAPSRAEMNRWLSTLNMHASGSAALAMEEGAGGIPDTPRRCSGLSENTSKNGSMYGAPAGGGSAAAAAAAGAAGGASGGNPADSVGCASRPGALRKPVGSDVSTMSTGSDSKGGESISQSAAPRRKRASHSSSVGSSACGRSAAATSVASHTTSTTRAAEGSYVGATGVLLSGWWIIKKQKWGGKKRRYVLMLRTGGKVVLHVLYKQNDQLENSTAIKMNTILSIETSRDSKDASSLGDGFLIKTAARPYIVTFSTDVERWIAMLRQYWLKELPLNHNKQAAAAALAALSSSADAPGESDTVGGLSRTRSAPMKKSLAAKQFAENAPTGPMASRSAAELVGLTPPGGRPILAGWMEVFDHGPASAEEVTERYKSIPVSERNRRSAAAASGGGLQRSDTIAKHLKPNGGGLQRSDTIKHVNSNKGDSTARGVPTKSMGFHSYFEMVYVAIYPGQILVYYTDDSMLEARGVRQLPPYAAAPMDEALYNYEHTICIPAPNSSPDPKYDQTVWWLAPDTPEEAEKWLEVLNVEPAD